MTHTAAISAIYGTESDLEKVADGSASVALRLAAAMLAMGAIDRMQNSYNYAQARSMITNRAVRGSDHDMMEAQVAGPLRHTRAPMLVAPDMSQGAVPNIGVYPNMPVGMDEGMVRLAAVAEKTGADLAASRVLEEMEKDAVLGMPQFGATSRMLHAAGMAGPSLASRVGAGAQKAYNAAVIAPWVAGAHVAGRVNQVANAGRQAMGTLAAMTPEGRRNAAMRAAYKGTPAPTPSTAPVTPTGPGIIDRVKNKFTTPTSRLQAEGVRQGVIEPAPKPAPATPAPTGQTPQQAPAPAAAPGHPATESAPVAAGSSTAAQAAPQQATAGAPPKDKGFDLGGFIDKSVGTPGRALRTVGGLAATGALAYGASKLLGKGLQVMSEENQPADWGSTSAGAPVLPMGVNQYGYAQRGTPFMT